jgi:hypothetical protein
MGRGGNAEPTDEQIELELLRLTRSRRPQLQPRVAALRAILKRRRDEERRAKPAPGYAWESEGLTGEQRLAWFELDLLSVMAQARGQWVGPAEWRRGSARVRCLQREADEILGAPDPFAAFQEWRASLAGP